MTFIITFSVSSVISRINSLNIYVRSSKCILRNYLYSKSAMNLNAKDESILLPPVVVKGMKVLDKSKFKKNVVIPWMPVDEKYTGTIKNCLKKYVLKLKNIKPLQPCFALLEGEEILGDVAKETVGNLSKRLLLNPLIVQSFEDIEESHRTMLKNVGITDSLNFSKIVLNYSNWKADEILRAVLPEDERGFSSYSIIGHIVHINLKGHHLPYKHIIGQVLLDNIVGAKTVVNKIDIIDNTFRNFKMEIICGENNFITRTKENYCTFELDFSAVYWNPRLSTEHERIIGKLKAGDILYDVFAGIGPFAISAAKKKCHVLANDLNPESYKWLNHNVNLNKVQALVKTFNKDGKDFIINDLKEDLLLKWQNKKFSESSIHITMNLPALAVSFLPAFCGLFYDNPSSITKKQFPIIHVYCFVTGENLEKVARELVETSIGIDIEKNLLEIHNVRNVSPKKEMLRVSFKLSKEILMNKYEMSDNSDKEHPLKKRRLSDSVTVIL